MESTVNQPRRRAETARVVVDSQRFAAGWRLVPGLGPAGPPITAAGPPPPQPSLVVDVVRPRDLVALTVEAYECDLVTGEAGPVLVPRAEAEATLVVRLAYQHLAERAIYETPARVPDEAQPIGPPDLDPNVDAPGTTHTPPIAALPARGSRLVFEVPAGEQIAFSSEGILAALGRLPLVVHTLATPRPLPTVLPAGNPIVTLPGGLVGVMAADVMIVSTPPRGTAMPDAGTTLGLSAMARDLRRARTALAGTSGIALNLGRRELPDGPREVMIGDAVLRTPPLFGPGGMVVRPDVPIRPPRPRRQLSRPPEAMETAIEAPFRLIISPSALAAWAHSTTPVGAEGAEHRVELWHTRLGVRADSGVDEKATFQRIIRAVWARDREAVASWDSEPPTQVLHDQGPFGSVIAPFRGSLDKSDRHVLVRQSTETWVVNNRALPPAPVDARALWLSALGAWLDLHGQWDSEPYSTVNLPSILSWDHVAPMGRDQFVRVVYPGYLFPCGHLAALVKLTERKMKTAAPSVAGLYQRMFLVIGEPRKTYSDRRLPFTELTVAPLVTPTLDPPTAAEMDSFFWPKVGGPRFRFTLHCRDHEGRPVRLNTPLIWVAEHFGNATAVNNAYRADPDSTIAALGQKIGFTPVRKGGDTMAPTVEIRLEGEPDGLRARPFLRDARVELPAVQALSPTGPVTIQYAQVYKTSGFGSQSGAAHPNSGDVWAEVPAGPTLSFGAGQPAGSDKAGGFLQPDLPIKGLSRLSGTVGDVAGMATKQFDPAAFLSGALPKLFGIVSLVDLLEILSPGDFDKTPSVLSEAVDRIEGFLADLERARRTAEDAVADANRLVARAAGKAAGLQAQANDALATALAMRNTVVAAVDQVLATVQSLPNAAKSAVDAALVNPLNALRNAVTQMEQTAPKLPPLLRNRLAALARVLRAVVDAADLIEDVYRFLNGLDPSSLQAEFRFEWRPRIRSWPSAANPVLAIADPDNALVLAVDGRASGKGEMRVDVLAELRDFALVLLPGAPLVRFAFDHLSFHAGTSGKPEVDVVLQDIEFLGILGFVETLKELIPFDGFSDPPAVTVGPEGLTAGFSLALPNVAVGVFALSNISLGADVQVPFLGKAVTVGFNFCTRERPFTLQVTFIGGGGWFLMRLSPDGLDVLELGLEAGATLSIDLGVASGSVSAMVGVYIRLEGDAGSLAGYFRIRGEVDVLGLISASLELYLELLYQFDTGKMWGRASLTIEIEVLVFSGSVTVTCERQFAGSKGDPTFAQMLDVGLDGTSAAWSEYCAAFAGA